VPRCPLLACYVSYYGAAIWPLSGAKRTSRGHRKSVVHDPRRHSAPSNDALRKVQSITSSSSSSSGRNVPSAFAVLSFRTNLNLVGCTTGMSAGFRPLEFDRRTTELECEQAPLVDERLLQLTTEKLPHPVGDAIRLVIAQSGIKRQRSGHRSDTVNRSFVTHCGHRSSRRRYREWCAVCARRRQPAKLSMGGLRA
jgi:hypothetical protein